MPSKTLKDDSFLSETGYVRASSRDPQITVQEWRGTCSGKHYLLKGLFAELGYTSRLIACSTVAHIDPKSVQGKLRELLEQSGGRFVDVHNYLVLELPGKDMIVDATWPLATRGMGTVVNERFVLGVEHQIACEPLHTWIVPDDRDAQEFKTEILNASFTPEEIAAELKKILPPRPQGEGLIQASVQAKYLPARTK